MKLPETYEQLSELDLHLLYVLWEKFYKTKVNLQRTVMLRPLWYSIQCENQKLKLEQKHISRLNKYAKDPEKHIGLCKKQKYHILPGTELKKTYKGQEITVRAIEGNRFIYNDETYNNLSAIAKEVSGKSFSGYDFFGIRKR